MKLTFLGTGTSSGVPMIGCSCEVCSSNDHKDNRLRSSALLMIGEKNFAIDCGPDFRQQMLKHQIKKLHGILFTHEHHDHTAGLDDVRGFNFFMNQPMNLYMTERVERSVRNQFAYIFQENKYPGIPDVRIHHIQANTPFFVDDQIIIRPIEVMHLRLPVLGFRIKDFTYITDANYISKESIEELKGTKTLVLNALRHEKHISHFTLSEAIEMAKEIGAEKTYFTHISHQLGKHERVQQTLPPGFFLAYDGLTIQV